MPQAAQQCPFCQLAANPEQTFDVHETEHFKAWLDINPRAKGHTMIVPKEHWTSMEEIGEHAPELFELIRIVMEKAKSGLGADGVSVVLNDGEAAGQRLEHFYAQVFPRFEDEENAGAPAGAVFQPMEDLDESDLEDISGRMEDASFPEFGGGKGGAATQMIRSNRGEETDREGGTKTSDEMSAAEPGDVRKAERVEDDLDLEEQEDTQDQQTFERGDTPPPRTDDGGSGEKEGEEKKKDKEKKKKRSTWDGEEYHWGRDGAEFK